MPNLKPMFVLLLCLVILASPDVSIAAGPIVEFISKEISHQLHGEESITLTACGLDDYACERTVSKQLPIDQYFANADFYPGPYRGCYGTLLIYRDGDTCYVVGFSALQPHPDDPDGAIAVRSTLMLDWGFDMSTQEFYMDLDLERLPTIPAECVEHLTEEMVLDAQSRLLEDDCFEKLQKEIESGTSRSNPKPMVTLLSKCLYHGFHGNVSLWAYGLDEDGVACSRSLDLPKAQFFPNADFHPGPFREVPYSTHLIYYDWQGHYIIGNTLIHPPADDYIILYNTTLFADWGFDLETQEFYLNIDVNKLPKMPPGTVEPFHPDMISEKLLYEKIHGLSSPADQEVLEGRVTVEDIW